MDAKKLVIEREWRKFVSDEIWLVIQDNIKQQGWVNTVWTEDFWNAVDTNTFELNTIGLNSFFRPKSLQGIEDNNGWILIEDESDLPKEDGEYRCFTKQKNISEFTFLKNVTEMWWLDRISHYKLIEKEKSPLY